MNIKWDEKAIGRVIDNEIKPKITETADEIRDEASNLAPRDTGRLASSIVSKKEGEKWLIVAETEYALYVELGTQNKPAQPYLRPAMIKVVNSKR